MSRAKIIADAELMAVSRIKDLMDNTSVTDLYYCPYKSCADSRTVLHLVKTIGAVKQHIREKHYRDMQNDDETDTDTAVPPTLESSSTSSSSNNSVNTTPTPSPRRITRCIIS